jgi:small-conductance mechanosensitive channel
VKSAPFASSPRVSAAAAFASGAAFALCGGCASRGAAPGAGSHPAAIESLLVEGRGLGTLLGPTHLLFLAALVAAAFGLNALIASLVKLAWRLGFDSERHWARTSALVRLSVVLLVLLALLRGAFGAAPVLTSVFALASLLGVLFLSGFVPNVIAGVGLTLRRRIRIGDRVKVGEHEGVVRELGITQLHLRGADGVTVLLPNRSLSELPVVVERARNSVPVRVRLSLARRADPALLEQLRQIAALSPYRAPDTLVDVSRSAEDELKLMVEIQIWAPRAQRDARAQLELALSRALGPSNTGPSSV